MKKWSVCILAAVCLVLLASALGKRDDQVMAQPETSKSETVVMYIGSNKAFIDGKETYIVDGAPNISPYTKNGITFVPVRFAAESFKVETSWDQTAKTAVINNGLLQITIKEGDNKLGINEGGQVKVIEMGTAAQVIDGRLFIPVRYVAEALGKEVFYDRGLIIIGENLALDPGKDKAYLDQLISSFTGLERVGSKERLTELLEANNLSANYVAPGFARDDVMIEESIAAEAPTAQSSVTTGANAGAGESVAARAEAATPAPTVTADAVKESGTDYSQTNIQVEGVDEADIIKTDGEYLYYVKNKKIFIIRAYEDGKLENISQINVTDDISFSEIFVDKNKVIAIGTQWQHPFLSAYSDMVALELGRSPREITTKAIVYDTSNKKAPTVDRTIEIKGSYSSSRKVGDSVYFIAVNSLYGPLASGDYGIALPTYTDSALGASQRTIGYDRIYSFPVIKNSSLTSIVGFNLDEPSKEASIETMLGVDNNIYMSENNLYIAGSTYGNSSTGTDVYKFSISRGNIVYTAKGSVPGTIINQFSMDEYKGYFRIGTTVDSYSISPRATSRYNCLYVLDGNMNITGKVEDIAPDEQIYSVRFMGDRAYMVTFKQVDPLFAIDLKDPKKPKIMGALKIPGYSNYLHPYDENHLIGFGKDTTLDQYGNAFYLGMKVSMFDVTDITNPKEMFVELIGDRGTESPVLQNHKALLFSKEKDLLAFPVTLYKAEKSGDPLSYGEFVTNAAYIYNINLKDGFTLKGTVSHLTDEDLLKSSYTKSVYEKYIDRALYIGNNLYTSSPEMIKSSNLNTLKEIDNTVLN